MHSLLPARKGLSRSYQLSRLAIATASTVLLASCATNPYAPAEVEIRDVRKTSSQAPSQPTNQGSNSLNELESAVTVDNGLNTSIVDTEATARQTSQAEYYQQQAASQYDQNSKVEATLSSAEYYIQANQHERAADLVRSIDVLITTEEHYHRSIIVLAYADYAQGFYQPALTRLEPLLTLSVDDATNQTDAPQDIGTQYSSDQLEQQRTYINASEPLLLKETLNAQQVDALLLSSLCYQSLGDDENAISALIRRESALDGSARAETTRYIWQVINAVPIAQRELLAEQSSNAQVRNRVKQSLVGKIGDSKQAPQQFNQWREDSETTLSNTLITDEWNSSSPRSIYVLLPLSSRYNKASQAVKAGIDREHELNESAFRPNLSYYDIGDNPLQIGQYYSAALRAGADFIIGPIGKNYGNEANNSSAYFRNRNTSEAPMLMLGGDEPLAAGNLRLSMSPEMEGQRVAERAWQDGYLSAGVLLSNSVSNQRTMNGFSERWLSLGGKLNKTIEYSAQRFDHSAELKQLFGIHQSEDRQRRLSQILGFNPKFSPYQRGDIDFVFMIADNKTGRIIRPQINFFTNSQMPVYATSAIYNGIEDKINDIDLDNTVFPVMPWVMRSGEVSSYAGQLNMLHAMGMDAYRVAGNVYNLRSNPNIAIGGNTGQLQVSENGEIVYRSAWGKFIDGELKVVDSKGLDLTPLESDLLQEGTEGEQSRINSQNTNSKDSYNDQNWDSRESRRKTGG